MKHIIYQALTRLWGNGKFSDWNDKTFSYLKTLGVDYIWYTGVPRHASGKAFVKGDPGCPYSISDWMDVNPYLADEPERRMEEFEDLVRRTHEAGFKVIMDYIPNHVAVDYEGRIAHHDWCDGDWTDTLKNDWYDPATFPAMLEILRFWASKGVDGFRCDMVELVPAESLKALVSALKCDFPDLLFVAEAYVKDNYRPFLRDVGFDLLYDKSGLYDTLRAVSTSGASARGITWNWQWLGDMQPGMLNFLENHDEQRLASPEFLGNAARGYASLAVSLLFNDASFMLYFGQELGENASEGSGGRTSIFNWCKPLAINRLNRHVNTGAGLPEPDSSILSRYRELLGYAALPTFREGNCWDLCYCNEGSAGFNADRHFAFLRYDDFGTYLVVCNFSDWQSSMRIQLPQELASFCGTSSCEVSVGPNDAAIVCLA